MVTGARGSSPLARLMDARSSSAAGRPYRTHRMSMPIGRMVGEGCFSPGDGALSDFLR